MMQAKSINIKNLVLRFLSRPGCLFSYLFNNLLDIFYFGEPLGKLIDSVRPDAYRTESTSYYMLNRIFGNVEIKPDDVLLDVGCGHGRVIAWWLQQGYKNRIYGIELNEKIAQATIKRFSKYPNVKIISGDVLTNYPQNATHVYLFNPFDNAMTYRFVQMLDHISNNNIRVIYHNCLYIENFTNGQNWSVIFRENNLNILLHGIVNAKYAVIKKQYS
jgi:hypothetical protein